MSGKADLTVEDAETLWPAPAKLNLFLHVLGRRPDGMHELQTVFRLIDRCDRVGIRAREDGEVLGGLLKRNEVRPSRMHAPWPGIGRRVDFAIRFRNRMSLVGGEVIPEIFE